MPRSTAEYGQDLATGAGMKSRSEIDRNRSRGPRWRTGLLAAALLLPCIASATLGQPEASVRTDATQLKGSVQATYLANYRVHEIQLPSGTAVREFVSLDGNVFAIAWSGHSTPNLRQMLGEYFDQYAAALQVRRGDHRHVQIQLDNLVVQATGHMRGTFAGRAYLPAAIPAGVSLGDLN
jgi:Protein of unknown function (DUF2844)